MPKTQRIVNLGQTYPQEAELSAFRIGQARRDHPEIPRDIPMFDVGVAVFVNGKIQYHGGATIGSRTVPSRAVVKDIAVKTLINDYDPRGEVTLIEQKD